MTLREQLIRHEGLRLKPYKCTAGKLTIGVGRNLEAVGISEDEAMFLLNNDIYRCHYECSKHISFFKLLSENRQNVLIDMCFNLGINGLLKFKKLLAYLEEGKYNEAAAEMLNSVWATQVGDRAMNLTRMMKNDVPLADTF